MFALQSVSKSFTGTMALEDISVAFEPGQVHVLLGENGAGKSTLIKILSGVYQPDSGSILIDGAPVDLRSARHGLDHGISVIHQELSVILDLTVAENIFLDNFPGNALGVIDRGALHRQTQALIDRWNVKLSPNAFLRDLNSADRQLVEILRAVSKEARLVIMDEATSSLSSAEIETLFRIVRRLRENNVAVVYISHKLNEILALGDRITILKDGRHVVTEDVAALTEDAMVRLMVGRDIGDFFIKAPRPQERVEVLKVTGLCGGTRFSDVSFSLHRGEVLGFAGLVRSGRTEVIRAVFGADEITAGEIRLRGEPVRFRSPRQAITVGLGLVPEDRRTQGALLHKSVAENITLASLPKLKSRGVVDRARERALAKRYIDALGVKTPSPQAQMMTLSGGNQQKAIIGRWLGAESDILLLDEPTRGIDVNAKAEIYGHIRDFVTAGGSVILVSSELPEIIGLCHRVVVMRDGRVGGIIEEEDQLSERAIMRHATMNSDKGER